MTKRTTLNKMLISQQQRDKYIGVCEILYNVAFYDK